MGVKQSKRSVDITETSTKGEIEGFGNEGKVEKIIDGVVEKVAANGHVDADLQNGIEPVQNGVEVIQNGEAAAVATEISEQKNVDQSPVEGVVNGQVENGEVNGEAEKPEEGKKSKEKMDKKGKKEKLFRKKFSFRSLSFSKKDKSKPLKEEKSAEKVDETETEVIAQLIRSKKEMEVQLKDESGKSAESLLEKSIALTNELQVSPKVEAQILKEVEIDLATVPENNVLKISPTQSETPEKKEANVQEKIAKAVNSAVEAVVGSVKGMVDSVKKKETSGEVKLVQGESPAEGTLKPETAEGKGDKIVTGEVPQTNVVAEEKKAEAPQSVLNAVADNAKQLLEDASKKLGGATDGISAKLEQAKDALSEKVSSLTSAAVAEGAATKDEVEQKIKNATEEVNSALKQLMQDLSPKQTPPQPPTETEVPKPAGGQTEGSQETVKTPEGNSGNAAEKKVEETKQPEAAPAAGEVAVKLQEAKDLLTDMISSVPSSVPSDVSNAVGKSAEVVQKQDEPKKPEAVPTTGGEVDAKLPEAKDLLTDAVSSATSSVKSDVSNAVAKLVGIVKPEEEPKKPEAPSAPVLDAQVQGAKNLLTDTVSSAVNSVPSDVSNVAGKSVEGTKTPDEEPKKPEAPSAPGGEAGAKLQEAKNLLTDKLSSLMGSVSTDVSNAAGKLVEGIKQSAEEVSEKVTSKAEESKEAAGEKAGSMIDSAKAAIGGQITNAEQKIQSIADAISGAVNKPVESENKKTEQPPGETGVKPEEVKNAAAEKSASAIESAKSSAESPEVKDDAVGGVSTLVQNASQILGNLVEDAAKKASGDAVKSVENAADKLQENVASSLKSAEANLKSAVDESQKVSQQAVDEMLNKAKDLLGKATEAKDAAVAKTQEAVSALQPPK